MESFWVQLCFKGIVDGKHAAIQICMNKSEPGWELYRTFLAVVREGSLSGAARALGLTQPTAGRHVDALEQALGMSLFIRTQQGLSPTEAALSLRPPSVRLIYAKIHTFVSLGEDRIIEFPLY